MSVVENIFFRTHYSSFVLLGVRNKHTDETFIIQAYFIYA